MQLGGRGKSRLWRSRASALTSHPHAPLHWPPTRPRSCHPELSAIPNRCVYGGRLADGVTAEQRGPLLPGLPPLAFCDLPNGVAQRGPGGSVCNRGEAQLVVRLVGALMAALEAAAGAEGQEGSEEEDEMEEDVGRATGGGGGGRGVKEGEDSDDLSLIHISQGIVR